jgi:Uma2 family endonuclease
MTAARAESAVTGTEYLARERQAQTKSEYLGGSVVAMSGASRKHSHIVFSIAGELYPQLRDSSCEAFINDMRVKIAETGDYTYPDVVVACGDLQFEDAEVDTLLTPTVIIEVLSPSTERYDRGTKWTSYRQLPTLQEYLLVAQDRPSIEHYVRDETGWRFSEVTDLDGTVTLPSIGCELRLREIYRRAGIAGMDGARAARPGQAPG